LEVGHERRCCLASQWHFHSTLPCAASATLRALRNESQRVTRLAAGLIFWDDEGQSYGGASDRLAHCCFVTLSAREEQNVMFVTLIARLHLFGCLYRTHVGLAHRVCIPISIWIAGQIDRSLLFDPDMWHLASSASASAGLRQWF
jgi:hypothetical protein